MSNRGSNVDEVRRYNRSRVLELVHRRGAVSRSELARATGLNRSTIADLVLSLIEAGLVLESGPDVHTSVGRPSPIVRPNPDCIAFAVNPEQDAVTVGVVRMHGEVVERRRHEVGAPLNAAETVAVVARMIAAYRAELEPNIVIAGIGVAVPGLVRTADGVVRLAPHLHWVDEPFAELLAEATGIARVFAANDASLGAAAECFFGAGRGVTDLIYLNGGASGIGGGVIANGLPLGGTGGYAGEFGHNLVTAPNGPEHTTTGGSLEDEVNRRRLLDLMGFAAADPVVFESALLGSTDPAVRAEVERQVGILSIALRNAINVLNPEMVVLGGFLAALFAAAPEQLERQVREQTMHASYEGVRIVRAELGADLLLIGAADLPFGALIASSP